MLRTARKITPIVSALFFGVAAFGGLTVASSVLIGCEDETKPEYFILILVVFGLLARVGGALLEGERRQCAGKRCDAVRGQVRAQWE